MRPTQRQGATVVESLRLAHENGFLSWTRNCVITTVAAAAVYQMDATASAGLFAMGSVFMYTGTVQYWVQACRIHRQAPFTKPALATIVVIPATLVSCWTLAVVSILDKTPDSIEDMVPSIMTARSHRAAQGQQQHTLSSSSSPPSPTPMEAQPARRIFPQHERPHPHHREVHGGPLPRMENPPLRQHAAPGDGTGPQEGENLVDELILERRRLEAMRRRLQPHDAEPSWGEWLLSFVQARPSTERERIFRRIKAIDDVLETIDSDESTRTFATASTGAVSS